jgi:hypothetical protein
VTDYLLTINVGGGFGGSTRHEGMLRWAESARAERRPA